MNIHIIFFDTIIVLSIILTPIGLIDLFRKEFKDNNQKFFVLLAILFTGALGTIIYFFYRDKFIKKDKIG